MADYRQDDPEEGAGGEGMGEGMHGWGMPGMGMGMGPGMWMHGKHCGCPYCLMARAWRKMAMMGAGMMRMGMAPWMGMMGGMGPGMGMGWTPGMGIVKKPMMQGAPGMPPWRHFVSSEEKIKGLEDYLAQLQMEEKGVQEQIDRMRGQQT